MRLVLGQAGAVIGAGLVVGLGLAVATGRSLSAFLFGVPAIDPLTYGAVALLLASAAAAAAWLPAWRAARVDPAVALFRDA
jgi:ABC-type antimicrobial peptide transport system permease subunit